MKLFILNYLESSQLLDETGIDEYSMMSHRQGNAKLEYNGDFRAQTCIVTGNKCVKQTLCYSQKKLFHERLYHHVSSGFICRRFHLLRVSLSHFNLIHLRPNCHYTPVGHYWMLRTSHGGLVYRLLANRVLKNIRQRTKIKPRVYNMVGSDKYKNSGIIDVSIHTKPFLNQRYSLCEPYEDLGFW